ncbi:MAG: rod shape-determining protein MreC [Bacteroidia bacterium]|nr:rod shape-determining protein MreC [Bacteroidia bacterium]
MRSLLLFILNHLYGLTFVFIQGVSIYLIYHNNTYTSSVLMDFSNEMAGQWYEKKMQVYQYFNLKKENEQLALLNAELLNKSYYAFKILSAKEYLVKDTIIQQEYSFINADVINSTFNNQKNYITLNVGRNMGIQRDMAVITNNGIVGSIKDVSEHYSTVITLLHRDFLVNGMLKDGSCGPLSWNGESRKILEMNDVPLHAKIKIGDTVYTSHFSHIFPQMIPIGTVEHFERKQKNSFYTVKVRIFTDFNSIKHVYVVRHIYKKELDSLQKKSFE